MSDSIKRPAITDEIIRRAANITASYVSNLSVDLYGKLAEAIAENYEHPMNGYELTKEMDVNHDWDVFDASFVESMDLMDSCVDDEHRIKCLAWVKENDIQPPLELGTEIEEGTIEAIADDYSPASYLVKEKDTDDSVGYRRLVVKFEDAVLLEGERV